MPHAGIGAILERVTSRFPAFASRNFRIFWITQFISLIGTWMQTTVQAYLAYSITGEPIYLGLVGFATTLPTLLFTLPGGVWVERLDKRKGRAEIRGLPPAPSARLDAPRPGPSL